MVVTVRDVLGEKALRLRVLELPRPEAEVRWVAVSELADPAPFLEGGEVLLTTGLDSRRWREEWEGYVGRLADVGVVALGLAVGMTHDQAPDALVEACRARAVNLFEVPRETTFVAISQAAVGLLNADERAAEREALDVQRRLAQAALRADDTTAVLHRLADFAGGAACLMAADGRLEADRVGPRPQLVDLTAARTEVARIRPLGLRAASSLSTPGGTLLVQPVGLAARPATYFVAGFPGRLSDTQRSAVGTAVALLSLADERRRAGRDTDRALRVRAMQLLRRGEARTAGLVLSARPAAPATRLPKRAVMLRASGAAEALTDALAAVEEQHVLSGLLDGELLCVAQVAQAARLAGELAELGLSVGVGEEVALAELERSHATAGFALGTTSLAAPVAFWTAAVAEGVLSLVAAAKAAAFARSLLAPLEGEAEQELLGTLHAFLRHHGSQVRVSEELGVHRNTVRHRLAAVEKALGRSLDDPQVRVDCWVALQARAAMSAM
jgi:Purine catabolism regulatory protein-like family/PucR C-terminal helix-turn-helix domain